MIGDILQPTHLVFILVVALLVLGPKRLPEAGRALGKGIRDFRTAMSGEDDRPDAIPTEAPAPTPAPAVAVAPTVQTSAQTAAQPPHAAAEPANAQPANAETAIAEPADAETVDAETVHPIR